MTVPSLLESPCAVTMALPSEGFAGPATLAAAVFAGSSSAGPMMRRAAR